jgi:outer membrane protein TolC
LPELIDLAETHNPQTRVAWERARAQAAALGIARSELYPTLAAAAVSGVHRDEVYLTDRFFRQTIEHYQAELHLNYTVFDFGARAGLTGGLGFKLNWTVFDGGARKSRLAQAEANVHEAEARASVTRNQIADQVWAAYSNLNTALRQRQAATALLAASSRSYDAALESYKYGLRNLLDVTAAQRTLAQARSTNVLARTQVLSALADLAFRSGDSIQANVTRPRP